MIHFQHISLLVCHYFLGGCNILYGRRCLKLSQDLLFLNTNFSFTFQLEESGYLSPEIWLGLRARALAGQNLVSFLLHGIKVDVECENPTNLIQYSPFYLMGLSVWVRQYAQCLWAQYQLDLPRPRDSLCTRPIFNFQSNCMGLLVVWSGRE